MAAPQPTFSPASALRDLIDLALKYGAVPAGIAYVTGLMSAAAKLRALGLSATDFQFNTAHFLFHGATTLLAPTVGSLALPLLWEVQSKSTKPLARSKWVVAGIMTALPPVAVLLTRTPSFSWGPSGWTMVESVAYAACLSISIALVLVVWKFSGRPRRPPLLGPVTLVYLVVVAAGSLGIVGGSFDGKATLRQAPSTNIWLNPEAVPVAQQAGLQLEGSGPLTKVVTIIYETDQAYFVRLADGHIVQLAKNRVTALVQAPRRQRTPYPLF